MSTGCQIAFYREKPASIEAKYTNNYLDWTALIYRHSDGYPGDPNSPEKYPGVLPDLLPFLRKWKAGRGIDDAEYCAARTLQFMCNEYDKECIQFADEMDMRESHSAGTLGHGICRRIHFDIDYFYAVYPDVIEVWSGFPAVAPEKPSIPIATFEI